MQKFQFNSKINLPTKIIFFLLALCLCQYSNAQDDCKCKTGEKITVCYYSSSKFCPPDNECRYTLDGEFMINSLGSKLQNPALFGPQGISKCPIILEVVEDVSTVEYLEQKECDIMFVGVFSVTTNGVFTPSSIPQSDFSTIKEWSAKCPSNLTIVSQKEAEPWGYKFENANINPNQPDPAFTEFSIFNGSFGEISLFNQGGTYQGVFTDYPSTGYSVLARDFLNEPTIVLDSLTNDIILGDIGVLCNGPGPLSVSPDIENDGDILACNLFDLGCKIATNSTTDFISICEGENYITSGGQVIYDQGVYVDSFLNMAGCDSLIYTLLDINILYDEIYTERICDDKEYVLPVGDNIYSQTNTIGTEFLESKEGCDSIVHIELYYFQSDTTYLYESICEGDTFHVDNIPFTESIFEIIVLQNKDLCDSFVYLDLVTHDIYNTQTLIYLCPGEFYTSMQGTIITEDSSYTEYLLSEYGCDSINTIIVSTHENYEYDEHYIGCSGDGFNMIIGDTVYNEMNPTGIEHLQSFAGCDSIIYVEYIFNPLDTTYLNKSICEGDTFFVGGLPFTQLGTFQVLLQNSYFCDSIVYLDLISHNTYNTQTEIDLCPGEVYVTTDGTILSDEGFYNEFLLSDEGCDSLSTIIITVRENFEVEETYLGCQNDGYSLHIGTKIYNESNPTGTEHLQSSYGCDSVVNISFTYQALDTTYLEERICPYESVEVGGIEYAGNTYETIILSSSNNCDSIVFLDLETYESEEVALEQYYEINLNASFTFDLPTIETSIYHWESDGKLSCNSCANPDLHIGDLPTSLQLIYTDEYNCTYTSNAEVTYRCTPFFSNILHVNSITEENRQFRIKALCSFDNYSLSIFDRWGALIYSSNDQQAYWDGTLNGSNVAQGVYIYQMKYTLRGQPKRVIGSLTVVY